MNVFELDADLIARYEKFARSFTSIRAEDLRGQIDAVYEGGKFWPEPLIGLNPEFKRGRSVAELARQGVVDRDLETVFSLGSPRTPISLHLHQEQALMKALQNRNYIVTTGTGSGKSLCFFVPIINRILEARRAGEAWQCASKLSATFAGSLSTLPPFDAGGGAVVQRAIRKTLSGAPCRSRPDHFGDVSRICQFRSRPAAFIAARGSAPCLA